MQNLHPCGPRTPEPVATNVFLQELDSHWTDNAGLREGTRKRYLSKVRQFLNAQFPTDDIEWTSLTPAAMLGFITSELRRHSNRSTQRTLCTAIRALFRYVQLKYSFPEGTALLLPPLPYWPQTRLPQTLSEQQIDSLLAACAGPLPDDCVAGACCCCLLDWECGLGKSPRCRLTTSIG